MAYFTNFPVIDYLDNLVKDITNRIVLNTKIKESNDIFFYYDLTNYDTPEDLAFNYYGDSNKHWVIILMNDIIDPFYDWFLSEQEVLDYAEVLYGKPTITNDGQYSQDGYNYPKYWIYEDIHYYINKDVPTGDNAEIPGTVTQPTEYVSDWNAETNTPEIPLATGLDGKYYVVLKNGTTDINGITDWKIGDWVISDGTDWFKVDNDNPPDGSYELTHLDYEIEENEKKRRIKILLPEFVPQIEQELNYLLGFSNVNT